jgi:hypothetical protein
MFPEGDVSGVFTHHDIALVSDIVAQFSKPLVEVGVADCADCGGTHVNTAPIRPQVHQDADNRDLLAFGRHKTERIRNLSVGFVIFVYSVFSLQAVRSSNFRNRTP